MNIKRWLLCAFLFLICFLILRWLNNGKIFEGYCGCGGGGGRGYYRRQGYERQGYGRQGYGRQGYYYGGGASSPPYMYDDDQPYWYRYVPFFGH